MALPEPPEGLRHGSSPHGEEGLPSGPVRHFGCTPACIHTDAQPSWDWLGVPGALLACRRDSRDPCAPITHLPVPSLTSSGSPVIQSPSLPCSVDRVPGSRQSYQLLPRALVTWGAEQASPWSHGSGPLWDAVAPIHKVRGVPPRSSPGEGIHTGPQAARGLLPPPRAAGVQGATVSPGQKSV